MATSVLAAFDMQAQTCLTDKWSNELIRERVRVRERERGGG